MANERTNAPRANILAAILAIIAGVLGLTASLIGYLNDQPFRAAPTFGGLFFLAMGIGLLGRSRKA